MPGICVRPVPVSLATHVVSSRHDPLIAEWMVGPITIVVDAPKPLRFGDVTRKRAPLPSARRLRPVPLTQSIAYSLEIGTLPHVSPSASS